MAVLSTEKNQLTVASCNDRSSYCGSATFSLFLYDRDLRFLPHHPGLSMHREFWSSPAGVVGSTLKIRSVGSVVEIQLIILALHAVAVQGRYIKPTVRISLPCQYSPGLVVLFPPAFLVHFSSRRRAPSLLSSKCNQHTSCFSSARWLQGY